MNQTIAIDCPAEILVSLHMNAKELAGFMKQQAAITLFREGRLSWRWQASSARSA